MMRAEEIKRHEKEAYDSVAEVFNAIWARYTARFAGDLIDLLFPQKGEIGLDIAGGTGPAGLKLAERLGKDGKVIITDLSRGMLEQAEKNAAARGLGNVSTRVMDAENLDYPDASFDIITCSFGVMFFPNVRRALAEARRVLRPGGKIGFNVWSHPDRTPFLSYPTTAVITRVAPAPIRVLLKVPCIGNQLRKKILVSRGALGPSPMRFSAPGSLEKHLRRAGFQSVRREKRAYPLEFGSFEEYWEAMVKGTPAKEMASNLEASVLQEVKEELRAKMVNLTTGGILIYNEAAQVLGKKPG